MSRGAVIVLALALLGAGCRGHEDESEGGEHTVGVRTVVVAPRDFPQTVLAIGTVVPRPGHVAALSAPGAARVSGIHVAAGQRVQPGDTLVEFERAPFEAAARSADAAVTAAQAAHERAVRLSQAGVLPRKEVDQAAAELAQAQSAAVTARRALELATLRAPLAGTVTTMNAVMGQAVEANQVLVEIVDPDVLDVVFAITPDAAAQVHAGAEVSLAAGEDAAHAPPLGSGAVSAVAVAVDSVTRAVAVRVRVTRAARALRLGESVAGRIIVGLHPRAIAIPAEGLVPDGDAFKVFVVDSAGLARSRSVRVGARSDSLVEIVAGLAAGETVVTYGAYGLEDSVKVVRSTP